ncbi:branched-chain amino acid transport system II carrier protein [Pasteurella bettyae]|uniref:Branched-chain amino acid transport system carrier protein n=1 Tax=Pasteurella bettyae CCUG 2042 TaxID=1095749 RepID=I3DJI0_9PAST|nr:branched-chain amino acid transport system II carrier protein [Pasteurella bettyae]EIJ71873.1 branched-chain amino acid transport system II carrier protein [Pasteurella bettyae CCUG 2042]SUB22322.1 putative branched-chain amino acid carrier protein SSP1343 [Pasteurella bettyae]
MNKNTFIVGFMLFAIFFGAGNLIFPPKLGLESGVTFFPAMLGFILSGVGFPLLGIIVSAFYEGGYKNALNRVHPWFSILFLVAIYLSIGPFFAIPRTAATAYEMAILPFIGTSDSLSLFIFTFIYFSLAIWFSINPSKMVERIGAILTPILLLSILVLVIRAVFLLGGTDIAESAVNISEISNHKGFFEGFINGYLTMDALAAIAFSVIVIAAIKSKGVSEGKALIKQTISAGIIAAISLGAIYLAIGWIGHHLPISQETLNQLNANQQDIGTYILNAITTQAFGEFGRSVLGLIVSLACLTTAIGLIVAVSEYFNEIYHKIAYKTYVIVFTLIGFIIANQGLNTVISKSIPVLLVLYPIAMTVMLLLLVNLFIRLPNLAFRMAILFVSIIAFCSVADLPFVQYLPLKAHSLEWLVFAISGTFLGYIFSAIKVAK